MSRKEGKTRAVNFGNCANIGKHFSEMQLPSAPGEKKASTDSKHAKIVKNRVNGGKNQVNLEKIREGVPRAEVA